MMHVTIRRARIQEQPSSTPALIFDERMLLERSRLLDTLSSKAGARLLFALKSLAFARVLETIKPHVDGFACSSLFEARLAREIGNGERSIHLTTPGMRPDEIGQLSSLCDYISFNSLTQWQRYRPVASRMTSCGLRVNPQLAFVGDDRYNPCRASSKLGAPLNRIIAALNNNPSSLQGLQGLHVHNNCDATDLSQLLATVRRLDETIPGLLKRVEWINVGGGYLFNGSTDLSPFFEAIGLLRSTYDVKVFIEPGSAIAREAGTLVSSVLDLFESDGKTVAVLDTTVNHMPEVFEYQCPPEVVGARTGAPCPYVLVGGTCLAGDLFGEFSFDEPLEVGSRIAFANAGAYTLVKAHMFNGINLPSIHSRRPSGELVLHTQFTYDDFARRNGVETHALV